LVREQRRRDVLRAGPEASAAGTGAASSTGATPERPPAYAAERG
jgi:hypothetical protein